MSRGRLSRLRFESLHRHMTESTNASQASQATLNIDMNKYMRIDMDMTESKDATQTFQ
jgi:hypothetical protein